MFHTNTSGTFLYHEWMTDMALPVLFYFASGMLSKFLVQHLLLDHLIWKKYPNN
jgi:hypothetical protein